jgi:hypothetical protein
LARPEDIAAAWIDVIDFNQRLVWQVESFIKLKFVSAGTFADDFLSEELIYFPRTRRFGLKVSM